MTPLTIAFTYDPKTPYEQAGYPPSATADLADEGTISAISNALTRLGHNIIHVPGIKPLTTHLAVGDEKKWDLVFNYSEGIQGSAREAQVPGVLEAFGVGFTLSDASCLGVCADKAKTKMFLEHHQIPTSPFVCVPKLDSQITVDYTLISKDLSYPLFAKPVAASTSNGITPANKIRDPDDLSRTVETLRRQFPDQEIMLEEFLGGTEYTVAILGSNSAPRVLGALEVTWYNPEGNKQSANGEGGKDGDGIDFATCFSKIGRGPGQDIGTVHVDLNDFVVKKVADVAVSTYGVLGCRDAARVDIRLSSMGVPNVIEVNPLFGLRDDYSLFTVIARNNGMEYHELLGEIVESAMERKR